MKGASGSSNEDAHSRRGSWRAVGKPATRMLWADMEEELEKIVQSEWLQDCRADFKINVILLFSNF